MRRVRPVERVAVMGGEEKQIPRDGGSVKELPYPASVGAVLGLTPSQDVPSVKTDSEFIDEAYPGFRFPNSRQERRESGARFTLGYYCAALRAGGSQERQHSSPEGTFAGSSGQHRSCSRATGDGKN